MNIWNEQILQWKMANFFSIALAISSFCHRAVNSLVVVVSLFLFQRHFREFFFVFGDLFLRLKQKQRRIFRRKTLCSHLLANSRERTRPCRDSEKKMEENKSEFLLKSLCSLSKQTDKSIMRNKSSTERYVGDATAGGGRHVSKNSSNMQSKRMRK